MTATQPKPEAPTAPLLATLGAAMPLSAVEQHRDWLFAGRDLELQDPVSHELLDGDWRAHAGRTREVLDGFTGRLGIHGPFWGLTLMPRDPAVREVSLRRHSAALAYAGEIGATHMVVHSPFDFFGHPLVSHTAATGLAEQLDIIQDILEELLPQAEAAGCTLVMENIRDTNPTPLLTLAQRMDHDRLRLSIDVGHAHLMQRVGGPTPEAWIRTVGEWLGHVHLQDNDAMNDWHWPLGDGQIHWQGVLAALATVSSQPRLILEVGPAQLERSKAYLESLGPAKL